ncbi:hypothetical protein [uncultured Chryseobacterium sp.]|uniref:hypothetical protein n=1 Tax=uncultured Chryseobacterium sp. TaxID=259322 RepID=UPI0025CFC236|nr:hypothetical protein [uncultured Chryseobacterium sp.]
MTDKFTIRDILVYTFLGFTATLFYYSYDNYFILNLIKKSKDYSSLNIFWIIPSFYLIGHIIMSIDDFVFNYILLKIGRYSNGNRFWKFYNFILFGFRNIGLRKEFNINDIDFFKTCDKLISDKKEIHAKAEYYQVMSDLFKGIFLIIFTSFVFDILHNNEIIYWKLILSILIWFRARSFSSYYIKIIKRNL